MQRCWWLFVVMGICAVSCDDEVETPAEEVVATTTKDLNAPAAGKAAGKLSKDKKSKNHVNTVASRLPACMFDDALSCIDAPVIQRWECPTTWVAGKEVPGGTTAVCRPPQVSSKCGAGEHAHPGSEGCARAGDPCPPGGWPVIEDEGEFVLYVKAGGMGDGMSPDQPLGDIQTAHNIAIQGSIILVAPGTYTTPLFINKEVTLIGACSEATTIAPPKSAKGDAVSIISPTTIKNFTISGGSWGVFVKSSGVTTLEGLVIEGVKLGAVSVFGDGVSTHLTLKDSAVRDIQLDGTVGEGFGVSIQHATASLERVSIRNVYNFGLTALSSTLDLKDVSIENVMSFSKSEEKGYGGIAVVATGVKAERLVVRGSEDVGIGGWSGSVFDLTDVVVTDSIGPGIFFVDSRAEIAQMEIHKIEKDAIVLSDSSLELERFRVWGVNGSQEIDNGTNAVAALNGSELNAHNGVLENQGETTLYFSRSSGSVGDLAIKGTGNVGLSIRDASLVDAERIVIQGKTFGVIVGPAWRKNTMSYANLTHIRIVNAQGYGIRATDSLVAGRRIEVRQSPVGFINQGEQGIVMLEEVEFSEGALESAVDPFSQNAYFSGGIGILAHKGSRTILSTSRLHHNRNANLILAGDYTMAELDHTRLEHSPDEALKRVMHFEIGGKRLATGSRKTFERYGIATFDKSKLTSETESPEKPKAAPVKPRKKIVTASVDATGKAPAPASPGGLTGAALGSPKPSNEAEEGETGAEEGETGAEEAPGDEGAEQGADALDSDAPDAGEGANGPAEGGESPAASTEGALPADAGLAGSPEGEASTDGTGAESLEGALPADSGLAGSPEGEASTDGTDAESTEGSPDFAQAAAGALEEGGLPEGGEMGLAGGMDGPDEGQNALDEAASSAAETGASAAMKALTKSSSESPEFSAAGLDGLLEAAGDDEEEPEAGSLSDLMSEGLSGFENLEIDDSKNEFLMGDWRKTMDVETGSKSAAKAALMKELGIEATEEEQAGMKAQGDAAVKDGLAMIKRMSKKMKGNALANGMKAIAHLKKQQGQGGDLSAGVFGDLSGSEAEEFLAKLEEEGGTEAVEEWLKDATENGALPNIQRDKDGEPLRDENGELMLREKNVVDYFSGFLPAVPGRPKGVTESDNFRGLLEGYASKYIHVDFTLWLRMLPKSIYILLIVLLATLLIGFFPNRVNCVVEAMETSPLAYTVSGVVITFLGGSMIALMTFSVVLAPVAFFMTLIFSFCWALGIVSLGISLMESLPFLGLARGDRDIPFLMGLALTIALMAIPQYGIYVFYATLCPCIGAAYATRIGTDTWVRK